MQSILGKSGWFFLIIVLLLGGQVTFASEEKEPKQQVTRLRVRVTSEDRPVIGATVYVKSGVAYSKDKRTNRRGIAVFPRVPCGQVHILVIKPGCNTEGNHYNLRGQANVIPIELKRSSPPKIDETRGSPINE